jgi:hypothetical protein
MKQQSKVDLKNKFAAIGGITMVHLRRSYFWLSVVGLVLFSVLEPYPPWPPRR